MAGLVAETILQDRDTSPDESALQEEYETHLGQGTSFTHFGEGTDFAYEYSKERYSFRALLFKFQIAYQYVREFLLDHRQSLDDIANELLEGSGTVTWPYLEAVRFRFENP